MGTSKSQSTPSGGEWSGVKRVITSQLKTGGPFSGTPIVGGTVSAAGGLAMNNVGGKGGRRKSPVNVSRTLAHLARFAQTVSTEGLDTALNRLGLDNLRGKPAVEVVAMIAAHLCEGKEGVPGDVLVKALTEAILEVATLGDQVEYESLAASLQVFLNQNGVMGLVEVFLAHLVFDGVWFLIENHSQEKSGDEVLLQALASAVEYSCRSEVRQEIAAIEAAGNDVVDWFGKDGIRLSRRIVAEIETRLMALK